MKDREMHDESNAWSTAQRHEKSPGHDVDEGLK